MLTTYIIGSLALISDLEGGTRGFAFASGMAAISADVRAIRAGPRVNLACPRATLLEALERMAVHIAAL